MAAQKGVQSRPPEARALDHIQRSIQHTPIILQEKSMQCGKSLEKRCMPGVGRRKIQPGRPRIREVLGRFVAPVTTQPGDKRAGGTVEGRNSAALIGRYPKSPTKVGYLNLHVSKFAKMLRPIHMPTSSSMPAHHLNNSVIHLTERRGVGVLRPRKAMRTFWQKWSS